MKNRIIAVVASLGLAIAIFGPVVLASAEEEAHPPRESDNRHLAVQDQHRADYNRHQRLKAIAIEHEEAFEARQKAKWYAAVEAQQVADYLAAVHAEEHRQAAIRAEARRVAAERAAAAAKAAPAPSARTPASGSVWDRLAQCESGGNWSINTGNGYYGGLQFNLSTWQSYGGTGYPHEHSRATQIAVAERLHAARGFQPWPACSKKLGLR